MRIMNIGGNFTNLFRFNKMSDEDKKRFIEAVTGAGGKIDSKAAAALIAAAASGGDPEIANKVSLMIHKLDAEVVFLLLDH